MVDDLVNVEKIWCTSASDIDVGLFNDMGLLVVVLCRMHSTDQRFITMAQLISLW